LSLGEMAGALSRLAGAPAPVYMPFPKDASRIDIGSFVADSTRIRRELMWLPKTSFEDGAARTLDFFREHLENYLDPANPYPQCHFKQAQRA